LLEQLKVTSEASKQFIIFFQSTNEWTKQCKT
jgi:hypothetical protein